MYKQQDTAELDAYGNDAIYQLLDNYRVFFEDSLWHDWGQGACTVGADEADDRTLDPKLYTTVPHRKRLTASRQHSASPTTQLRAPRATPGSSHRSGERERDTR